MEATRPRVSAGHAMASITAINRRSTRLPAALHPACPAAYAKFALLTMHAHRLWIKLWITLGHPEENFNRPEGNAGVTRSGTPAAHSRLGQSTAASHRPCAQPQRGLAGRILVIPGIHRPYDDYQSCNDRQIQTKVGRHPSRARSAALATPRASHSGTTTCSVYDEIPDQIRRGDR